MTVVVVAQMFTSTLDIISDRSMTISRIQRGCVIKDFWFLLPLTVIVAVFVIAADLK